MYLPAGRLHAYLEGTGLELMASSDNVLRGGLTPKHVDLSELHQVLQFESTSVDPILPRRISATEEIYDAPAEEFLLSRITLRPDDTYQSAPRLGARIILCTEGDMILTDQVTAERVEVHRGMSLFISGRTDGFTLTGKGVLYVATIP